MVASSNSRLSLLQDASYDNIAIAIVSKLCQDRELSQRRLGELIEAEKRLHAKQEALEAREKRLYGPGGGANPGDVIELNVGGKNMTTTREVLLSAEGSLLSGLFSGNFDDKLKRDSEKRVFLDVDPVLFEKILSHLRMRRIASPDQPAPLPKISADRKSEYDMMVRHFGLEGFMYGQGGESGDIFKKIADQLGAEQSRLATNRAIQITLSSTGGVPAAEHEEVLGSSGFHERSMENRFGQVENVVTIKFLMHRIRVEAMELRANHYYLEKHMSKEWSFKHGVETVQMAFPFTSTEFRTGRMSVLLTEGFVDEIQWHFPIDYCLEQIVLWGRVTPR